MGWKWGEEEVPSCKMKRVVYQKKKGGGNTEFSPSKSCSCGHMVMEFSSGKWDILWHTVIRCMAC